MERSASEQKKGRERLRYWKCDDCGNLFATTSPYSDDYSDGELPQCCPYCGVLYSGFDEL